MSQRNLELTGIIHTDTVAIVIEYHSIIVIIIKFNIIIITI